MTDLEAVPANDPPAHVAADDDAVPAGYERVTAKLIFRKKSGDAYVKMPTLRTIADARRFAAAQVAVAEEFRKRNKSLAAGNRVLDNAVKTLADDRARVEAWELQFQSDRETFPGIGWVVREEVRADGATFYFVVYAPVIDGEQQYETWRGAMNTKLRLDEIQVKAVEAKMRADLDAKLAEVKALVDQGVPEPEAMARVFPAAPVEPESPVAGLALIDEVQRSIAEDPGAVAIVDGAAVAP